MSIYVMSWVLKHSDEKLGRRLVLLVLADHAKEDGTFAWPSVETIGAQARLSRRAVQSALRGLEEDGAIIRRGESKSKTTIYDVVMRAQNPHPGGAQLTTPEGANSAPEPSGPGTTANTPQPPKRGILSPAEEPEGFAQWLGQHVALVAKYGLGEQSVPRAATSHRTKLAQDFMALRAEGYSLEDFELASEGVIASKHMQEGGWIKPENVLRKTKMQSRVDDGRKAREQRDAGSKYDGLED